MLRWSRIWIAVLVAFASTASADTVKLKNGASFEGILQAETDEEVKIQSDGIVWTFTREQIESVSRETKGRRGEQSKAARIEAQLRKEAAAKKAAGDVVIYYASWCPTCRKARAYLEEKNVPYTLVDTDSDKQAWRSVQQRVRAAGLKAQAIPVIDVKGKLLVGWDPSWFEKARR